MADRPVRAGASGQVWHFRGSSPSLLTTTTPLPATT
jgi:hypothetical protein